jgi:hypothetical protein
LAARQQGAVEPAQQDEMPSEALRRELQALDRSALRAAAHADTIGPVWNDKDRAEPSIIPGEKNAS